MKAKFKSLAFLAGGIKPLKKEQEQTLWAVFSFLVKIFRTDAKLEQFRKKMPHNSGDSQPAQQTFHCRRKLQEYSRHSGHTTPGHVQQKVRAWLGMQRGRNSFPCSPFNPEICFELEVLNAYYKRPTFFRTEI